MLDRENVRQRDLLWRSQEKGGHFLLSKTLKEAGVWKAVKCRRRGCKQMLEKTVTRLSLLSQAGQSLSFLLRISGSHRTHGNKGNTCLAFHIVKKLVLAVMWLGEGKATSGSHGSNSWVAPVGDGGPKDMERKEQMSDLSGRRSRQRVDIRC